MHSFTALSHIEGRIQELEIQIETAQLIPEFSQGDVITLGSCVLLKETDGQTTKYKIVGAVETDPEVGLISNESPLGSALLNHREGDCITVNAPSGSFQYEIIKICQ